ncbi:MAG: hypothetical protein KJ955_03555 [Nanoarchaeota archaeon]|nr:hypothetical protein [Nanoarchaeota archaeon]
MKKGAFISLGMFMLAGLVFSAAVLLFHNTQSADARFAEMALYDRLYDMDSSMQLGFQKLFNSYSGISLSITGDKVVIEETLPRSSSFILELEGFLDYSSSAYSADPMVSYDEAVLASITDTLPIHIMPQGITIRHASFPSGNLEIEPSSLNIYNYSLYLGSDRMTSAFNDAATTSGSFPWMVSVATASGTSTWSKNVDASALNTLSIIFDDGLPTENTITVSLDNPAKLVVNKGSMQLAHRVSIGLGDRAEAYLDSGLYSISFEKDKLSSEKAVKLA